MSAVFAGGQFKNLSPPRKNPAGVPIVKTRRLPPPNSKIAPSHEGDLRSRGAALQARPLLPGFIHLLNQYLLSPSLCWGSSRRQTRFCAHMTKPRDPEMRSPWIQARGGRVSASEGPRAFGWKAQGGSGAEPKHSLAGFPRGLCRWPHLSERQLPRGGNGVMDKKGQREGVRESGNLRVPVPPG